MSDIKSLRNLTQLVATKRLKKLKIVDHTADQGSKIMQLYQLLKQQPSITTETELIKKLYDGDDTKKFALKDLTNRLEKQLLNSAFFLDYSNDADSLLRKKQQQLTKKYASIPILKFNGVKELATKMTLGTLKLALEIESLDIAYMTAKILRRHYAYIDYKPKQYQKYKELTKNIRAELLAEAKTDELYDHVSHMAIKGDHVDDPIFREELKLIVKEMIDMQTRYHSQRINYNGYQIRSYFHLLNKEYQSCIEVCDQAISFFRQKKYSNQFFDFIFNNDKFESLISLGKIDQAKEVLYSSLKIVGEKSFNWFKIKRMELSMALFEKEYNRAYLICKEVVDNPNFSKFKTINEQWKIRIAYIQVLLKTGYVDIDLATSNPLPKFNWNDILKTLPLYSKDKRGLNITIIVAQLIFKIIDKKSNDVLDRIDALNRYCSRYLKNNRDLRSNCFLKMISKLPEANFHPLRVERYVLKYKKRLFSAERVLSQEISSTEIIAYEVLWDIIIKYIAKK